MQLSRLMRRSLLVLAPAALSITANLLPTPVSASEDLTEKQQIAQGKALAAQWCAHCHTISPEQTASAQAGVPSFMFIANKDGQTADRIADRLIAPHPPMPDLQLSRDAISGLTLYILSLKEGGNN